MIIDQHLYRSFSSHYYLLLCTISSSIRTTRCDSVVSGVYITYYKLDHSAVTKWHHFTLYSKSGFILQYTACQLLNVQYRLENCQRA